MQIHFKKEENQYDRLISTFLDAPQNFLSKEDVRQDVMFDEYASDSAVRTLIYETRKRLVKENKPWQIITIHSKGYKLIIKSTE